MQYRPNTIPQTDNQNRNAFNDSEEDSQHGILTQPRDKHRERQLAPGQQLRGEVCADRACSSSEHQRQRHADQPQHQPAQPNSNSQSHLLSIPPETLTSITSHLHPPSLLSLGCTSAYLAHHIRQDNTWRRAFLLHFLGISPESDFDLDDRNDRKAILLRKNGETWREEFLWRYVMIRRWSRSKNLPTTHTPLMHSPISAMHLLSPSPSPSPGLPSHTSAPTPALLTASTQYGIIARSFPLSAKVLPGFLDASPTGARHALGQFAQADGGLNGIGIPGHAHANGNPNAQFTPNITTCALSSSVTTSTATGAATALNATAPPTAHIAWGSRAGEVIFTAAPRAMDGASTARRNPSVRVRRCAVGEEHEGSVADVRWVDVVGGVDTPGGGDGTYAVSAGTDGRVKLWEANASSMCLWTSETILSKVRLGAVPDPCVRVEGLVRAEFGGAEGEVRSGKGCILSVVESGDIHVWVGFGFDFSSGLGLEASTTTSTSTSTTTTNTTKKFSAADVREIVIPCPVFSASTSTTAGGPPADHTHTVKALYIDPNSSLDLDGGDPDGVVFLVAYEDDPVFYRVRVRVNGGKEQSHDQRLNDTRDQIEITPFGDPNFGRTSVVVPFFARRREGGEVETDTRGDTSSRKVLTRKEGSSVVFVGDHMGCVSLYAWDSASSSSTISNPTTTSPTPTHTLTQTKPTPPLRSFEAHRDGASVSALRWDGLTLITGSARGTTHVWDGLTFAHLRSFVSPVKRVRGRDRHHHQQQQGAGSREAVRDVLVTETRDVLVVAVGDSVMAWHAGGVSARDAAQGAGVRGRHVHPNPSQNGSPSHPNQRKRGGGAKVIRPFEMRQTILESRSMLDSDLHSAAPMSRREREHRAGLESLGLSEAEAVEYVLMLSRDEADARERERAEVAAAAVASAGSSSGSSLVEEEVFERDFGGGGMSAFGVPGVSSSPLALSIPDTGMDTDTSSGTCDPLWSARGFMPGSGSGSAGSGWSPARLSQG